MDVIVLWEMWHIADNDICTCGEPVKDCFYWALVKPANDAAKEKMYSELFS